jgi:hypothetical protein
MENMLQSFLSFYFVSLKFLPQFGKVGASRFMFRASAFQVQFALLGKCPKKLMLSPVGTNLDFAAL